MKKKRYFSVDTQDAMTFEQNLQIANSRKKKLLFCKKIMGHKFHTEKPLNFSLIDKKSFQFF